MHDCYLVCLYLLINFNILKNNCCLSFRFTTTPSSCLTSSGRDNQWESHQRENKWLDHITKGKWQRNCFSGSLYVIKWVRMYTFHWYSMLTCALTAFSMVILICFPIKFPSNLLTVFFTDFASLAEKWLFFFQGFLLLMILKYNVHM